MIVVRLFGREVLAFGRDDQADTSPGDVTTTPVGFVMLDGSRYEPPPGGHVE